MKHSDRALEDRPMSWSQDNLPVSPYPIKLDDLQRGRVQIFRWFRVFMEYRRSDRTVV